MIDEVIKQSGLLFIISIQIPIQLLRYIDLDGTSSLNSTELFLSSFFLTVFSIFVYILITLVPPKLEEEMCNLYPEYKVYLKAWKYFNLFVLLHPLYNNQVIKKFKKLNRQHFEE